MCAGNALTCLDIWDKEISVESSGWVIFSAVLPLGDVELQLQIPVTCHAGCMAEAAHGDSS